MAEPSIILNSACHKSWRLASPITVTSASGEEVSISWAIAAPQLMPITVFLSGRAMPLAVDIAVRMPAKEPGPISTAKMSMFSGETDAWVKRTGKDLNIS